MNNPSGANSVGGTPAAGGMPDNRTQTTSTPGATGETPAAGGTPQPDAQQQPTFDSWLAAQDETVKGLIAAHVSGLRSSVESERSAAKEMAKQLKKLTGDLDANSDAAKQLGKLTSDLEAAQKRAEFVEAAALAGCTNPKLAYLAAQADELKTMDQVKAAYPLLFAKAPTPASNAGNGARQPPGGAASMNDMIRQSAGRK